MGNGASRDQDDIFDNEVNLFQFKLLRVIGKGSFGKVRMVERRETGKVYALKYISKVQVIKMDAVRNILRERQILESVDHAFVVNMRFAFQDDDYMYMCMDLMMGGDLRFHMNRRSFGEDTVRFWIAEISSALNHLHSLGIVHRDIKPDNVLLDERGHAHLTDFNISCKLVPERPILTSQSGTVAYMAPEVFKGTGYGTSVDWWALGVIFYECIYNQRPFSTESIADLKRAISNQTIEYPAKESISRECVLAIEGFLTRDPAERLGINGGMNGIRHQPFFEAAAHQSQMNLEQWWYMLESKQLTPKFQPPSEAANFDVTYDLEEMLLDEDPLTYRSTHKRAQRLQREKDRVAREENARLKAEHEAALAATVAAEAAMEAMNRELEESIRKKQLSTAVVSAVGKKRSLLQLFAGESSRKSNDSSATVLTQSPPTSQPRPQSHRHTLSQASGQTQFQSIPLSPIDAPSRGRDGSIPHVHSFRFPPSPPANPEYTPRGLSPPPQDQQHSSSYREAASPIPPPVPAAAQRDATGSTYSTSTGTSGAQESNVTAVYLSETALPRKTTALQLGQDSPDQASSQERESNQSSRGLQKAAAPIDVQSPPEHAATLRQQPHPFQAAHPQKAITSPVIIPTPLDHSISRDKHIPTQSPQPLPQHQSIQQLLQAAGGVGVGPRRPLSPGPAPAIDIAAAAAAAAAAMANMSLEDRVAYQMELIDREFTTFDYTVYESYDGLVDPVTMSVGNPPEWVRSRD